MAKMTKLQAIAKVKNWESGFKDAVRKDVAKLQEMNRNGSSQTNVRICAHTAFILERCFRSGVSIMPETILEVMDAK